MKSLFRLVSDEVNANRKLMAKLEQFLRKTPEGRIEISMVKGHPKFYQINQGVRKYIRSSKTSLIQPLIEKSYYQKLLRETRKAQHALIGFLKEYDPDAQANVYKKMHDIRKEYVRPLAVPYDVYAQEWLKEHQELAAQYPNSIPKSGDYITANGEVVRSKSEILIADLLKRMGLLYVYECPLQVPGGWIYPDFTILNPVTRETWYWEHRGMMDKEDYVDDAMRKNRLYAEMGLFPGNRLIFTEETQNYPLRTKDAEALIRLFFFESSEI